MKKYITFLLIMILLSLTFFPAVKSTDETTIYDDTYPQPVKAYPAKILPKIDGVIEQGEWNDTHIYEFTREFVDGGVLGSLEGYTEESTVQLGLKYSGNVLYILYTIDDDNSTGLELPKNIPYILTDVDVLRIQLNFTSYDNTEIGVLPNGLVKIINTDSTYILIYGNSSVDAVAGCTYNEGHYVFEISLNMKYLHIKNLLAPFEIGFSDRGMNVGFSTAWLGRTKYIKPWVFFSNIYYLNMQNSLSRRNLTVLWNNDNISNTEKYEILISNNQSFPENNTTTIDIPDKNTTSYEFTNLPNGKYYFKLLVYNSTGIYAESNAGEVTVSLWPPSCPTNLTAILSDSKVNLTWNPPINDGNATITEYRVYRGISPDSLEVIASVNGSVTEYIDSNVSKGKTYYYSVSAMNPIGESNLSESVSIEIPKEKPSSTPSLDFAWIIGAMVFITIINYRKRRKGKNEL